ncbi:sugar ABC transporter substrate-binding protein [Nocardioides sp. NPDC087217]|uniref:sugar ABC transporter substrate-binding protein n=1 Tax=Nocardioides sp. NPDC087217 TaxID=3364335 RepID=UPI00381BE152
MNTHKIGRLMAVAAVATLSTASLVACGGSDDGGDSGDSGGTDVGVILPDATTSPRWESQDRPNLEKAFADAGLEATIQNAQGDTAKFGQLCDSMINENVKVIIITNLDSESGAACLKKAADAGVTSIDYDRLTLNGGASYYVSFDNVKVGELMGTGLDECITAGGKKGGNIVYVNGAATDNNAALFKSGYEKALEPKIADGTYKLVGDQSGEWDATKAGKVFDQMYTANGGKIDGVVSANDTMAGGIIARLKANNAQGKIPVTGQDASVEGLQNILQGFQCGTVYKNTALEAKAAADLAIALIEGDEEAAEALATGSVEDTEAGTDVPSVLAEPVWVTKESVKTVIEDGQADAAEVCAGAIADLCTENGVPQ